MTSLTRLLRLLAACLLLDTCTAFSLSYKTRQIFLEWSSYFRHPLDGFELNACSPNDRLDSITRHWYAPEPTWINNLSAIVHGHGTYGFIFNASQSTAQLLYGVYNWCNMPHIRAHEYTIPPEQYELEYVEVIHRHHKRTPYASNTFPHDTYSWNCDDEALFTYATPLMDNVSARIYWQTYAPISNPFYDDSFHGSCHFPQITAQGLLDSRQHGRDIMGVYRSMLGFLPTQLDDSKLQFRVTNNPITSQVLAQVVAGMYPSSSNKPVRALIQPPSMDSLEPSYACPAASRLYSQFGVGSHSKKWTRHLALSRSLFHKLDSVSDIDGHDSAWHEWFDHYFDNLSSLLCHAKPLPCNSDNQSLCILQEDAEAVFRRGEYEYSFIYRDSPSSLPASVASFGVWMAEVASNIRAAMQGNSQVIYRHNIAHDGSLARLLSILQVNVMVWPGMGSEVIFELYSSKQNGMWYLRVLWGGQVLQSSHPSLGLMNMMPAQIFLDYIDDLVGTAASKILDLCS